MIVPEQQSISLHAVDLESKSIAERKKKKRKKGEYGCADQQSGEK
jgi:hypothetical protein